MEHRLYIAVAMSSTGRCGSGLAFILLSEDEEVVEQAFSRPAASSYRLELGALLEGLKRTQLGANIWVSSESVFINRMIGNDWLELWQSRHWYGRANTDLLKRIYPYRDNLRIARNRNEELSQKCLALAQEQAGRYRDYKYRFIPISDQSKE